MKSLISFYKSSIGKKVVMSLTGLFLCLYLVEHLAGNLLLFVNDGGMMYETYSEIMVSNPVIRVIEVVLFASLLGHALSGLVVWIKNRSSAWRTKTPSSMMMPFSLSMTPYRARPGFNDEALPT